MASIINSTDTGSGGLITTGDSSDELQIQTAETTAITITSGQQSAFIAGTASAPAVTTTGDLNTGIYFPAADNIGFTTGGTIRGRWTTDGLCFGTDTAAANALSDYEEGTWTPVDVSGASLTFTVSSSPSYTKIGRLVIAAAIVTYPSTASGSTAKIGGFPFTIANAAHYGCFVRFTDITVSNILMLPLQPNTTNLEIYDGTSLQSNANVSTKRFDLVAVYITS